MSASSQKRKRSIYLNPSLLAVMGNRDISATKRLTEVAERYTGILKALYPYDIINATDLKIIHFVLNFEADTVTKNELGEWFRELAIHGTVNKMLTKEKLEHATGEKLPDNILTSVAKKLDGLNYLQSVALLEAVGR